MYAIRSYYEIDNNIHQVSKKISLSEEKIGTNEREISESDKAMEEGESARGVLEEEIRRLTDSIVGELDKGLREFV